MTLGEYLTGWMEALPVSGRKESTVSSYRHNLRLHVVPYLEGTRLQALTPLDLDHLYSQLLKHGRRNAGGGPLSRRTVRYIHTVLSAALEDAVTKGLLLKNPAPAASPPSARSAAPPETGWWTPDQLHTFLEIAGDHELGALFRPAGTRPESLSMSSTRCSSNWPAAGHSRRPASVASFSPMSSSPPAGWCSPTSSRTSATAAARASSSFRQSSFRMRHMAAPTGRCTEANPDSSRRRLPISARRLVTVSGRSWLALARDRRRALPGRRIDRRAG